MTTMTERESGTALAERHSGPSLRGRFQDWLPRLVLAPSFLLVTGLIPFWDTLRQRKTMQAMLRGVNAAVVGVLLAALYTPVWTAGVHSAAGFGLAVAAFLALALWAISPWIVVVAGALIAAGLGSLGVGL